jgi:hypothetical protein
VKHILASITFIVVAAAHAQNTPAARLGDREQLERIERLIQQWELESDNSRWRQQVLERQGAGQRRSEFVDKVNRFVAIWNRVMNNYNQKGVFNLKDARDLSKAFRTLEATGWPR